MMMIGRTYTCSKEKMTNVKKLLFLPQKIDPGGTFEGHESVNNKRRHRSSPHRTHARKHRMHASATVTSREYQASTEYEETGYNSGDEYVPPQHPDNIEEVWTISCLCHTSVNACRYLVYLVGHPMCQINENSPHQP